MRWLSPLLLLLASAHLTGCVSYWRGQEMDADMKVQQAQIEQLIDANRRGREKTARDLAALDARFGDLERSLKGAVERLQTGSADNMLVIESLREELNSAKGTIAELQHKLASEAAAASVGVTENPDAPTLPQDPVDLYKYGWERRSQNDCPEAMRAFALFVRTYPTNGKADNAQFLLAECQFQARDYSQSLRTLRAIMQTYPKGDKIDDALELMHDNFLAMGKCKEAQPFLETLIADYPRSSRVAAARKKLAATKRACK